jgi:hypothetical protein
MALWDWNTPITGSIGILECSHLFNYQEVKGTDSGI